MNVTLLAVGQKMPRWVIDGFEEYRKRLVAPVTLELREIPARRRGKNADVARIIDAESTALLAAVPPGAVIVALDRSGRRIDTPALAGMLQGWIDDARDVALLVGGPEGLSAACLEHAQSVISLSDLTFAHPLVRVVIAEQIYRAFSILRGLPYHR